MMDLAIKVRKELVARRKKVHASLSEILLIIEARTTDCDFTKAKNTVLYKKHGAEYCETLEIIEGNLRECANCMFSSKEGGDIVPYGSTTAQTPEYYVCDNPLVPEDEVEECMENSFCKYWEGK